MHRITAGTVALLATVALASCGEGPTPPHLRTPGRGPAADITGTGTNCTDEASSGLGLHALNLRIDAPADCGNLAGGTVVDLTFEFKPSLTGPQWTVYIYQTDVYPDGRLHNIEIDPAYRSWNAAQPYHLVHTVYPGKNVDRVVISIGHSQLPEWSDPNMAEDIDREFVVHLTKPSAFSAPTLVREPASSAYPYGRIVFGPLKPFTNRQLFESCSGQPVAQAYAVGYTAGPTADGYVRYVPSHDCAYEGRVSFSIGSSNGPLGANIDRDEYLISDLTLASTNPPPPPTTTPGQPGAPNDTTPWIPPTKPLPLDTTTTPPPPPPTGGEDPPTCFDVYDQYGNLIQHDCKPVKRTPTPAPEP